MAARLLSVMGFVQQSADPQSGTAFAIVYHFVHILCNTGYGNPDDFFL